MELEVSPLAPQDQPECPPIAGIRLATAAAGIKYKDRTDVLLARFDRPAQVAGVFTRSRCPSAPVSWCRARLGGGRARALLVNSGNANAFTGQRGEHATRTSAGYVAERLGCPVEEVFLASTGVIGEPLDADKFAAVVGTLADNAAEDGYGPAARAIMTTDTFPKISTRKFEVEGRTYTLNGIAKGSGMIAPDMATMLAFLFTDAPVAQPLLQRLLESLNETSFNAITVDSDTSTSDTVLLFSLPGEGASLVEDADAPLAAEFAAALGEVLLELAHLVVRDGEGARKFVEVAVRGAESDSSARIVAKAIANSPLVKTAIAGEDANWGRVVMAVGKAGEPAERDLLAIWFGDTRVAHAGERDPGYDEAQVSRYMRQSHLRLAVDLGIGSGEAVVWTCDLTKQYVAINGDYRS